MPGLLEGLLWVRGPRVCLRKSRRSLPAPLEGPDRLLSTRSTPPPSAAAPHSPTSGSSQRRPRAPRHIPCALPRLPLRRRRAALHALRHRRAPPRGSGSDAQSRVHVRGQGAAEAREGAGAARPLRLLGLLAYGDWGGARASRGPKRLRFSDLQCELRGTPETRSCPEGCAAERAACSLAPFTSAAI